MHNGGGMLRKVWEFLLLIGLVMVVINILVAAIKPFLPVIGIAVICLGIFYAVKAIMSRKKFW